MKVIPYKQTLPISCLASCLLMCLKAISDVEFNKHDEQKLTLNGLMFTPRIYHIGIIHQFTERYQTLTKIWVDNLYFTKVLKKLPLPELIKIENHKINLSLILEILQKQQPFIIYLDIYYLRVSTHDPHFVVVERIMGERVVIVDPWQGKRFFFSLEKLQAAIESLKTNLGYCPILITFIDKQGKFTVR